MNQPYGLYVPDKPSDSNESKLNWSSLLATTYRIYRKHFFTFFLMSMPVLLFDFLFREGDVFLLRQIFTHHWLLPMAYLPFFSIAYGFFSNGFYWLTGSLLLGAVASKVIETDEKDSLAISDAYDAVRRRMHLVLAAGLIAWTIFDAGREVTSFILSRVSIPRNPAAWWLVSLLPVWLLSGLISRMGLTVPELLDNPQISLVAAIRNSIKKTEDWEPFFMAFVAKTAILGYTTFFLLYWLSLRAPHYTGIHFTTVYWISRALQSCLAAMLSLPLFIAFSVLYRNGEEKQESSQAAIPGF